MTVKELITELLEYDMDYDVEIEVQFDGDSKYLDVKFGENSTRGEVYLQADLFDNSLVETDRLEELEDEVNG